MLGLCLAVLLGVLVVAPLAKILQLTVAGEGLGVWQQVVTGRLAPKLFYEPLANTLIIGLGVAVGTTVLGCFMAWVVMLTDVPLRRLLGVMATLPFMVPSFAVALAWGALFRNDRIGGSGGFLAGIGIDVPDAVAWGLLPVVIVLTLHYFSLTFALVAAALGSINSDLIEAGQMTGASRMRVLWGIILPVVLPAVVAGASLSFANGVSNFAAPALLGLPVRLQTLSTRIFGMIQTGQVERGFVLAMLLIAVAAVFLWAGNRLVSRRQSYATITGKGSRNRRFELGRWRWPVFGLATLICTLATIVPAIVLILSSVSRRTGDPTAGLTLHFWVGQSDPSIAQGQAGVLHNQDIVRALSTSISLGLSVAVAATAIGLLVAYFLTHMRSSRLAGPVGQLSFMPLLVPGIAFGAAYIALFGRPIGPFPALYGTFSILVIAGAAYLLPFAVQAGRSVMGQVSRELEESARLSGASFPRRLWQIFVPLTLRGLLAGALLVFVKIVRDLSLVVLLFTPATPVLTVVAFRYASEGFLQFANAITVIILCISVAATLLANRIQAKTQPWANA